MTMASAAGKAILLGEHAVVYGRPAIAVPVSAVRAHVQVEDRLGGEGVQIVATDLGRSYQLDGSYDDEYALALQTTVKNVLEHFAIDAPPALIITIRSDIPIARGMGSGTAVATALVRALSQHLGRYLTAQDVSALVYRTEVLLHGTPSGIDNTVVAFEKPVYFVKGREMRVFWVGRPFHLLIADTGVPSRTRDSVAQVRQGWEAAPDRYERLFDEIGAAVDAAQAAIAHGDLDVLGMLMNRNQRLLQELGVSSPELDRLVDAALHAGALGAKLSGGGKGGCMIALISAADTEMAQAEPQIATALLLAGAQRVFSTTVR